MELLREGKIAFHGRVAQVCIDTNCPSTSLCTIRVRICYSFSKRVEVVTLCTLFAPPCCCNPMCCTQSFEQKHIKLSRKYSKFMQTDLKAHIYV